MINNAGVMPLSMMKNVREDEWELMVDVNIKVRVSFEHYVDGRADSIA